MHFCFTLFMSEIEAELDVCFALSNLYISPLW
jgi:hypothetical protein